MSTLEQIYGAEAVKKWKAEQGIKETKKTDTDTPDKKPDVTKGSPTPKPKRK